MFEWVFGPSRGHHSCSSQLCNKWYEQHHRYKVNIHTVRLALRSGNRGYSWHRSTNIRQYYNRLDTSSSGLDVCCTIQRVRIWHKEHESMDASCLESRVELLVVLWGIDWHFGPLRLIMSIPLWPVDPSSNGFFQHVNIISHWFVEHNNNNNKHEHDEFTVLIQAPIHNPIEHLKDVTCHIHNVTCNIYM